MTTSSKPPSSPKKIEMTLEATSTQSTEVRGVVVSPVGAKIVEKRFPLSKERAAQLVIKAKIPAREDG